MLVRRQVVEELDRTEPLSGSNTYCTCVHTAILGNVLCTNNATIIRGMHVALSKLYTAHTSCIGLVLVVRVHHFEITWYDHGS
ncbi:hypothetical protein PAHAL_6G064400 [Panicum hallii]|jgi:hypothetical protein|uniref:Uncharacterized protein n=1 Tax=Panicum hallii TaxID=206008 RepID=A0A2T8IFI7_9POAL|nr:hypothetical protein PAHAL_6G064400 [Panicum hallii]